MSVRRIKGIWNVDIAYTDPVTGERKRFRQSAGPEATKSEAIELLHRCKIELETPPAEKPKPVRIAAFSGFAKHWFDTHIQTNCKASYIRTTNFTLAAHLVPYFADRDLRSITPEDVERYKASRVRKLAPKTINNHLGTLSGLMQCAVDWGYCDVNPVSKVDALRAPPTELQFWDAEQSEAFLSTAQRKEPQWIPFFMCALHTGMRLGELLALEWDHVDFVKRRIHIKRSFVVGKIDTPKNGRARFVPMTASLREALMGHRHLRGKLVFPNECGNYLNRSTILKVFARLTRAAGLPSIRIHDLRHSFASQLMMSGRVPLKAIQQYLGHADLTMTMRYAHLSPDAEASYIGVLDEKATADLRQIGGGSDNIPRKVGGTS